MLSPSSEVKIDHENLKKEIELQHWNESKETKDEGSEREAEDKNNLVISCQ